MNAHFQRILWLFVLCLAARIPALAVTATGGIIENNGMYRSHTFTENGTLTVLYDGELEILVVAGGGGGGGGAMSGGGGAGGVIWIQSYNVVSGDYAVVVGAGGSGGMAYNLAGQAGSRGANSSFNNDLIAVGGGGGAGWTGHASTTGGSGGGGNSSLTAAAGTAGQGYAGARGAATATMRSGGGGGGAGEPGHAGIAGAGGKGGDGILFYGNYYGGGGGGGLESPTLKTDGGGAGGLGGGGAGSSGSSRAMDALPNSGGGGGGAGYNGASAGQLGGNGGSGVVIVRYKQMITNGDGATDVTASSARLNGALVSTNAPNTAVSLFWGATDDWYDLNGWDNYYHYGPQVLGPIFKDLSGLLPDAGYFYCFVASNETETAWASKSETFITGEVWLEWISHAAESGIVPGTVMVHRVASAATVPLNVGYSIGGTATPGEDYLKLSGKVVIPAGAANAVIEIVPLFDHLIEGTETVEITLLPGPYIVGTENQAIVVDIADYGQVTRTWSGAGKDALASNPANWLEGEAPIPDDKVLLDATGADKPMIWDIDLPIGTWLQTADYNSTVTFTTVYPEQGDFTNFVVNGDVVILGGTWTHTANSGGHTEVNRLCATIGGNFILGTNATINLNGRGYAAARGPGAGNAGKTTSGRSASHGGLGAENVAGKSTYGSAFWPENLGSGAYSAGGGALKLIVSSTATINGKISAKGSNAASDNNYCHGAGGSILIVANTISGTGNISAGIDVSVRKSYHGSGGGRVALHALASADFTGLTLDTYSYTSQRSGYNGGAGTIYLSDPNDARLIIDQGNYAARAGAYTEIPATLAEFDLDPAFSSELANAWLVVTNNGNASLTRDLRIGGVAWVGGSLRLNSWTLYNKAATPSEEFPTKYGNGTIALSGVFYTFDDGTALTRPGRLFWGDSNVTWRVESLAYPVAGGTATFDGGQTANFYAHGSTPEFTAVPETGYDFLLWDGTLDSDSSTIANPLALAPLSGNKALRAWFLDAERDHSTNTWSATQSTTDWFDPRNWSLATIPVTAQTAIIPTGANVILTGITPRLAELLLSGGTFSFDGWESRLCADKISLNSGTMTHQQNTATAVNTEGEWVPNARVHIDCTDLTLAKTAKINVDAKGYLGGPSGTISGRGPGGGKAKEGYTAGAAYGGYGAVSSAYTYAPNALPYGNPLVPTDPGSGGCSSSYGAGGNGGGAVYIKASNSANIHGSISANGGNYGGNHASGGSGGAIYIECDRLYSDNGSFIANGGIGQNNGFAGGGGRIAIAYSRASQLVADLQAVTFDTSPGSEPGTADMGSLAFTDAKALHSAEVRLIGQVYNLPLWEVDSLMVTNWRVRFCDNNFTLTVTNDLTISGNNARLEIGGTVVSNVYRVGYFGTAGHKPRLNVGGDMTITNGGHFTVYASVTNGLPDTWGAEIDVAGTLTIAANSRVYAQSEPVNGGSPKFTVGNLTVLTNGLFSAAGRGFLGSYSDTGHGPGKGNGAGYGGKGYVGATYGSRDRPQYPGSGGASSIYGHGGHGGGLVRVVARRYVTIDGTVNAAAGAPVGNHSSGGSGGGIFIECARFKGMASGSLSANGGNGTSSAKSSDGGGGGGRIAIWTGQSYFDGIRPSRITEVDDLPEFDGNITADAGTSTTAGRDGKAGTIALFRVAAPAGTVFMLK